MGFCLVFVSFFSYNLGRFLFWDKKEDINPLMPGGNKKVTKTSHILQQGVWVTFLLPPGIKRLILM